MDSTNSPSCLVGHHRGHHHQNMLKRRFRAVSIDRTKKSIKIDCSYVGEILILVTQSWWQFLDVGNINHFFGSIINKKKFYLLKQWWFSLGGAIGAMPWSGPNWPLPRLQLLPVQWSVSTHLFLLTGYSRFCLGLTPLETSVRTWPINSK